MNMVYKIVADGLEILISRNSHRSTHVLDIQEKKIYLSAVIKIGQIDMVSSDLGIPIEDVSSVLKDFEKKGIILFSSDKKSFLSLAIESTAI